MPYDVLLPLFGAALSAGLVLLGVCAALPPLRGLVPYGWRMLLGASLGCALANLGSLLVGVVPALCALALRVDKAGPIGELVSACALLGLFVGPLVVSPLGFAGGAWLGLRRARRALHPPAVVRQ